MAALPKGETETEPDAETTGVFRDESYDKAAFATEDEAHNDETARVLEGNEENTGVSLS
jgi:hypothetical protein